MQKPVSHSALMLLAMAAVLALLVGLVRSAARPEPLRRTALGRAQSSTPAADADGLRTPVLPAPSSAEDAAHPAAPQETDSPRAGAAAEIGRLSGYVFRPEGQPASGARVLFGPRRTRCDGEGRFELGIGVDSDGADLLAFEPGFEPALRPAFGGSVSGGGTHEVRLVLGPPTLSLEGRLVAPDGEPVKGWTVELDGLDPLTTFELRERVKSDGDGRFVLPEVPSGVHVLRAFHDRRDAPFRSQPAAAGESGLTIVVDPRL